MIVADTNVIAYLLIKGEHTAYADQAALRDPEWVAPPLWRSEFLNVLACYLHRGHLTVEQAFEIMAQAETLMEGRECPVDSRKVLSQAAGSRCAAYDCEFAVLAQDLGVPLVTSDRRLLEAFPGTAVSLEAFAAGGSGRTG